MRRLNIYLVVLCIAALSVVPPSHADDGGVSIGTEDDTIVGSVSQPNSSYAPPTMPADPVFADLPVELGAIIDRVENPPVSRVEANVSSVYTCFTIDEGAHTRCFERRLPDDAVPDEDGEEAVVAIDVSAVIRDYAMVNARGSGITVHLDPDYPVLFNHEKMVVSTSSETKTYWMVLLGKTYTIHATPVKYTWYWGDGNSGSTTIAGDDPVGSIWYKFDRNYKNRNNVVSLTTQWSVSYTDPDTGTEIPVMGDLVTSDATGPFTVARWARALDDRAEEITEQERGWGNP